jgi:PKD repeat protein
MPAGWHWSFGDGDTSASQFPYHQFRAAGYHTITLQTTTAQGCSGSDTFRLLVPQSVGITSEPDTEPSISIYPNPSNGRFTLSCMYLNAEPQISIYNTLGQLIPIAITPQTIAADLKSYTIEIAAKGLYLIDVNMGSAHQHMKVVNK